MSSIHNQSAQRGKSRLFAAALLVFAFPLLVPGCKVFGNYDNTVDPGTANYQGHVSATSFEELSKALPDVSGAAFSKITVPELIGASDYEIRLGSDADNPEATAVLTASASSNELSLPQRYLAGKRYSYQFRAQKGGSWSPWSAAAAFELRSYSPSTPAPADGGSTTDTTPTLSWTAGKGETTWVIQTATETAGFETATPIALEAPAYSLQSALAFGSTLYWRVAPKTDAGLRGWSKVYSVTVSDWSYSLTPTPANGATTSDTSPLLDWNDIDSASHYELQISATIDALPGSEHIATVNSEYQFPSPLALGDARYWRVRAMNADGVGGGWSPIWVFSVVWTYVLDPIPADSGTTSNLKPLLDWEDVVEASAYEVQIAHVPADIDGSNAITVIKSEFQLPTALGLGEARYWRVRAKNQDGVLGAWSKTWNFATALIDMVSIPAGSFNNGTSITALRGFRMAIHEVAQALYHGITGWNPSSFSGNDNAAQCPVEMVTWYDAVEFCNKLSMAEGRSSAYAISGRIPATGYPITSAAVTANWDANGYRLPSEAEWEYAARSATTSAYYWGDATEDGVIGNYAWCLSNSGSQPHVVGAKLANAFGLFDMAGNVWEYCWDFFGNYASGDQENPTGPSSGTSRVERGGGWAEVANHLKSTTRLGIEPGVRFGDLGFRVIAP